MLFKDNLWVNLLHVFSRIRYKGSVFELFFAQF